MRASILDSSLEKAEICPGARQIRFFPRVNSLYGLRPIASRYKGIVGRHAAFSKPRLKSLPGVPPDYPRGKNSLGLAEKPESLSGTALD